MNNPCIDCPQKQEDGYGFLCDFACGKHSAYVYCQAGIREAIELIERLENPYSFQDGKCIPKYEAGYNGYENCRKDIIEKLGEEIDES